MTKVRILCSLFVLVALFVVSVVDALEIDGVISIDNGHLWGHRVTLTSTAGELGSTVTGEDGRFVFSGLDPGSYTLTVTSYWYPVVEKKIALEDSIAGLVIEVDSMGLSFAADWDSSLDATFMSAGSVEPTVNVASITSPGYVGSGALLPELLYAFPGANDLLSPAEGTIDLWTQLPDDDQVYHLINSVANEGFYVLSGWGRFFFQFTWRENVDGDVLEVLDAARFLLADFRGEPIHITMTWRTSGELDVYVNGQKVTDFLRRTRTNFTAWVDVGEADTPLGVTKFSSDLVIGSSASATNVWPYPIDQLSIRKKALTDEEILADYLRKSQFLTGQ